MLYFEAYIVIEVVLGLFLKNEKEKILFTQRYVPRALNGLISYNQWFFVLTNVFKKLLFSGSYFAHGRSATLVYTISYVDYVMYRLACMLINFVIVKPFFIPMKKIINYNQPSFHSSNIHNLFDLGYRQNILRNVIVFRDLKG